jgi:SAM-dependent methyltransferase
MTATVSPIHACRSCGSARLHEVIDLGLQPLANNLLRPGDVSRAEPAFPLALRVCRDCGLMQISHTVPPVDLFSDYVYFSSFSDEMLRHARAAADQHTAAKGLGPDSFVVEIASNDGYLLKNFLRAGIPCLGFEPAANVAETASAAGIETRVEFFGRHTASVLAAERRRADLILGNNVFAHAPDPNDFVAGLAELLADDGWAVLEFPYGVDFLEKLEFDTIYHEHVFYYTLTPLLPLFARHGLEVFRVERIPIHGGSLRLHAARPGVGPADGSVEALRDREIAGGILDLAVYDAFRAGADRVKADLSAFLDQAGRDGKRVAAYGASAKGSTLLNYVGDPARRIEFIADRSPHKHGKLSPGLHLPIVPADELAARRPDYAVLLVWNFAREVMAQQSGYTASGGRFVVPLPRLTVAPGPDAL